MRIEKWTARIGGIIFWICITYFDVLIVEGIFRPTGAWDYIRVYHLATWAFLTPVVLVLGTILAKDWRFAGYGAGLIYTGWEDLLYFPMAGMPLPDRFTWLVGSPTPLELLLRGIAGMTFVLIADYLDSKGGYTEKLLARWGFEEEKAD